VAPLGTSLTEDQAAHLAAAAAHTGVPPIVATDADLAGQIAAERDYWMLTQHALTPRTVRLRPSSDPADILETAGPEGLRAVLHDNGPLADTLVRERLDHLSGLDAVREVAPVFAAAAPATWVQGVAIIAERTGAPEAAVRRALARAIQRWDHDPRAVVAERVSELSAVRDRAAVTNEGEEQLKRPAQPARIAPAPSATFPGSVAPRR
jgi:DNA primase